MSLAEIKTLLRSLVVSAPEALTVRQLNKDYQELEDSYIPYAKHGFPTLEAFLRSIPDTLSLRGDGPNAIVVATISEKSEHIRDLVCHQKKTKKKSNAQRNAMHYRAPGNNRQYTNRNAHSTLISSKYVPAHLSHTPAAILPPTYNNLNLYNNNSNPTGTLHMQNQQRIIQAQQWLQQQKWLRQQQQQQQELQWLKQQQQLQQLQQMQLQQQQQQKFQQLQQQQKLAQQQQQEKLAQQKLEQQQQEKLKQQQKEESKAKQQQQLKQQQQQVSKQHCKNYKTELTQRTKTLTINESKNTFVNKISSTFLPPSLLITEKEANKEKSTALDSHKDNKDTEKTIKTTTHSAIQSNCATDNVQDDEAVPAFAVNNTVVRLDFPAFTVQYGEHITACPLPADVKCGDTIHIFIAEVHSPYKFWFHMYKEDHELDKLMYQMERVYKALPEEELQISKICITPGQVCAALYNKNWHRAEILSNVINNKVKVFFMDYGTVWEVPLQDIKYLLSKFAYLPQQALRGSLSHIKPYGRHWDHKACTKFLSMVFDVMLFAKITEINENDRILHMILCDPTNEKNPLQINTALVKQHHALFDESWQQKQLGERVHHMREDFPTFAMLEKAEYPTLKEIIQLIQMGIHYERIQDNRLYNSCRLSFNCHAAEIVRQLPFELLTTNPFRRIIMLELVSKNDD